MDIAATIKKARQECGLTQAQLAEKASISLMSIRRYESRERQPNVEQLQRIAAALDISLSELLNIGDLWWERTGDILKEQEEMILAAFDALTPDAKMYLLARLYPTLKSINSGLFADEQTANMEKRFADVVAAYGDMAMSGHKMCTNSKKHPYDYLMFSEKYEQCIRLIDEHKAELIEIALAWPDDNTELLELIYGPSEKEVADNATQE